MTKEEQEETMKIANELGFSSIEELTTPYWQELQEFFAPESLAIGKDFKGVPQGANTSPICSILALNNFQTKYDGVHYADDGLIFSNEPLTIVGDARKGIYINHEKSGPIKENGVWLKNIKFLGLEYLWKDKIIRGKTRKGSDLEFGIEQKGLFAYLALMRTQYSSHLENLFNSKYGPNVMSKLYNNSWDNIIAEGTKKEVKTSWSGIFEENDSNSVSSTEACQWLSRKIKSNRKHTFHMYK
jgi:hypothetical protein